MKTSRRLIIVVGLAGAASIPLCRAVQSALEAPAPKRSAPLASAAIARTQAKRSGPVPVLQAELGISPSTREAQVRTDRLGNPILGDLRCEVGESGNELCDAELAPGYDDVRSLPEAEAEESTARSQPAPPAAEPRREREKPDPRRYGYANLRDMELAMRHRLKIPSDQQVALSIEERNGKRGVVIDVSPAEGGSRPPGTEKL